MADAVSQNPALQFRLATAQDAAAVAALVQSAYRGAASQQGWTTEADFLEGQRTDAAGVLEAINNPDSAIVLAEYAGEFRASALIEQHGADCHFGMFAVRPTLQSSGIGKALLAECERRARADFACVRMVMWVIWLRESLIAFYARRGYAVSAQRQPFPYGDARFGLPLRDDLYFIVMIKDLG